MAPHGLQGRRGHENFTTSPRPMRWARSPATIVAAVARPHGAAARRLGRALVAGPHDLRPAPVTGARADRTNSSFAALPGQRARHPRRAMLPAYRRARAASYAAHATRSTGVDRADVDRDNRSHVPPAALIARSARSTVGCETPKSSAICRIKKTARSQLRNSATPQGGPSGTPWFGSP